MADAYLKVKDNGANGLELVREESDVSVTDLKNATGLDFSVINMAYVAANGTISAAGASAPWNLWCAKVEPGQIIDSIDLASVSQTIVYAFFASKPVMGAVSYNNARVSTGTVHATNIRVPDAANWIAIRYNPQDRPVVKFRDMSKMYTPSAEWIDGSAYDSRNGNLLTESYTANCCYARIPVNGNKKILVYTSGFGQSNYIGMVFFGRNNQYISGVQYAIAAGAYAWITADIPDGAYYIGLSANQAAVTGGLFGLYYVDADTAIHEAYGCAENSVQNPIHTTPIYVGDFLIGGNEQHGCVCKIDNKIYCFVSNNADDNVSNNGRVFTFDLATNTQTGVATKLVGHANSCAYDPINDIIYVAPVYDYENNKAAATYIYMYNKSLTYLGKDEIGVTVTGVSYDPVTRTVWASRLNGDVYRKLTDGTWELVFTVPFTDYQINVLGGKYDQGVGVFDNNFFFPSSRRSMLYGRWDGSTFRVTGGIACSAFDSLMVHRLGELEDCEFTADGHLLAADYNQLSGSCKDAFVIELPVGITAPQIPNVDGGMWDAYSEITLSADTQAKFCLARSEVRTLAQIYASMLNVKTINVVGTVNDPNRVFINQDTTIKLNGGALRASSFYVRSGTLTILNAASGSSVEFTASTGITLTGGGNVAFRGNGDLTVTALTNDILANDGGISELQFVPQESGGDFRINGVAVSESGIYAGSEKII